MTELGDRLRSYGSDELARFVDAEYERRNHMPRDSSRLVWLIVGLLAIPALAIWILDRV